jgi:hypothetical protein
LEEIEEEEEFPPAKKAKPTRKASLKKAKAESLRRLGAAEMRPPAPNLEEIVDAISGRMKEMLDAQAKAQKGALVEASLTFEVGFTGILV